VIAGLIAKFGGPALKYGLIALALAAAVVAALFYIDGVREEGFKAGKAETEVQVITNTVIVKEKIQRAEDRAPRSPAGVSQRLREGTF
jgi:hypothetical protein